MTEPRELTGSEWHSLGEGFVTVTLANAIAERMTWLESERVKDTRLLMDANRLNARTCEWRENVGGWDTGCLSATSKMSSFCPDCGGKVEVVSGRQA